MRLRVALALLLAVVAAAPVVVSALWLAADVEQSALRRARDRVDLAADASADDAAQLRQATQIGARALATALERGLIVAPEDPPGARRAELARRLAAGARGHWDVRGLYDERGRWLAGAPELSTLAAEAMGALGSGCLVVHPAGGARDLEGARWICGHALSGGEAAVVGVPIERLAERSGDARYGDDVRLEIEPADVTAEPGRERRVVQELRAPEGAVVARVVVSSGMDRERELAAMIRRTAPMVAGAAALLALVLGFALGGRVQRPLRELEVAADRIGRGDLEITLQPSRSGASGTYSAFNRMARDLQNAQARAKRAERVAAWRDIARRIAHEIKNPLTPIRMSIETMRRTKQRQHPDFDEIFEESTRTVLEEAMRLERIVTEFSRFARLPRPQPTLLDVREVVAQVVQLHSPGGDATITDTSPRLPIKMSLADDLPKVRADRDQLTQVLVNLVQNAIDAAQSKRGDQGHVEVAADPTPEGGVRVTVSDDGPGIPEEERARILEPYYTTKARGTGLGLAIVDRIVSEHGGFLEVGESRRGGAAISFTLTREGPSDDPEASQTS